MENAERHSANEALPRPGGRFGRTVVRLIAATLLLSIPCIAGDLTTGQQQALAYDYAMSGMAEEAKKILIPLLHDGIDEEADPDIRLILATTCLFLEENETCTAHHWDRITADAPNSAAADQVRQMRPLLYFNLEELPWLTHRDALYRVEIETARKLWSFKAPSWWISWKQVDSAKFALQFLAHLEDKYEDEPDKLADILYQRFLIELGFNSHKYGLLSEPSNERELYKKPDEISERFLSIPGAEFLYVQTQFMLGIAHAEGKYTGRVMHLSEESLPYFERVLDATEGQITDPFRIFSLIWMKQYDERMRERTTGRDTSLPS